MSYVLGILPAFAYLHEQGLVYCDFKPDNVMLEGDDVKLIDMGAVRRIGDPHGDIYGTLGYKAPEADDDPVAVSDLFTIGRTLTVLLLDFDNTGRYVASLPPPGELLHRVPDVMLQAHGIDPAVTLLRAGLAGGAPLPTWLRWNAASRTFTGTAPAGLVSLDVQLTAADAGAASLSLTLHLPLAANECLYRFLLKATASEPDRRFQSADEMAAQLTGVLRETVARDGPIPAVDSAIFLSEQSMPGNPALLEDLWRRLPNLRLDAADSAVAAIFAAGSGDAQSRRSALERIVRAQPNSAEARLRLADALIDAGPAEVETVMRLLDAVLALDPADWRPDWYCGKLYLSLWRPPADAIDCFDNVYTQIPGEPAAKLALAMALEADGRTAEASGLYDTVSRTDPALVSASFGFARCMTQAGNRAGAVAALARVPDSAALAATARIASVHILADGMPGEADLRQAAQILAALDRDDRARHEAEATVALAAARQAEAGALIANGAALLGVPVTGRALRARAEAALRACARLSDTQAARIGYIDQANAVRPRTLL